MSASLESLVRQSMSDADSPTRFPGIVSFLAIGAGAAVAFTIWSSAAIWALPDAPRWLVSAICYGAFIVPVYLLHRRFSFDSDASHAHALPRYVAVQLGSLAIAAAFSFVAYSVMGLPTMSAGLLVICLTSGVNFLVLRRWAFLIR